MEERQLKHAKLVFEDNFDDLAAFEAQRRGYLSHVAVELEDGARYPVTFYDPVRLQQEELMSQAPSPRDGLQDLLWALMNSREFLFNH